MKRREFLRATTSSAFAMGMLSMPGPASGQGNPGGDTLPSALVVNGLDQSILSEQYVEMCLAAGVDCWHTSLSGLRSFADVYSFVDRHGARIRIVRSVAEIQQAKREGKLGLLLGWENADWIGGSRSGDNDWWSTEPRTELRAYYELGLRSCGIAYQIANAFGGGGIDGHVGLTRAGRRLVEQIHGLKIILDVGGHTGDRTSLDALAMSSGVPVICSHGNARALANSSRNLSDRVMEGIAETGGVIGINAINDFVMRGKEMAHLETSPLGTVDDMVRHADYIKKLVGADHVGLGPDFTHGRSLVRDTSLFGPDVMDRGLRRYVRGFEDITELSNVKAAFRRIGWTDSEIRGVLGGNWIRVYEQVWGT